MRIGQLIGPFLLGSALLLPAAAMATPITLVCRAEGQSTGGWTMNIDPDAGTAEGVPAEYTADTITWQKTIYGNTTHYYVLNRTTGVLTDHYNSRDWDPDSRSWSTHSVTATNDCEKGARKF